MESAEKKIKIALFIRGFHNGGIEKVFELYYSHMNLSPFEIHVITHMENDPIREKIFTDMGCIIHPLSKVHGHKLTKKNFREYKKLFENNSFDVVHNNMPENLLPLFFAKRYGVEGRILHAHNIYTAGYEKKNPIMATLFRMGFSYNASQASTLIGVSKDAAKSAFGKKNVKKVILLPNAINIEKYSFNPEVRMQYRDMLQLGDSFVFGHVGRYENDQKNQEFVLNLFAEFLKKNKNSRLLMIGNGKRLPEYKMLVQELGIEDKVIFTGNVQNVSDYMQAMDMFLFPSRKEGLGVVLIEAQATGMYCIASNAVPEEAKVTRNVKFLDIDDVSIWIDEICEHMNDERKYTMKDIVEAGYDIHVQAHKLENLYSSLKVFNE